MTSADPDKFPGLSKSRYCAGLQCHKLLHIRSHNPELIPEPDPHTQFIFDQGTETGELATEEFRDGVTIPAFPIDEAIEQTKKALEEGAKHIFEAAFNYENIHVKVDILVNHGNDHVDIIEVKSSSGVKDVHIDDMAIQRYVLEGNGFVVGKTSLMHLSPYYVHPRGHLFIISNETAAVNDRMQEIPSNLDEMRKMLQTPSPPDTGIGPHCTKPYDCALRSMCWEHIPDMSIFNIPRFGKKWEFYEQGIIELDQLPDSVKGTPTQKPFLDAYRSGKTIIDKVGLESMLAELEDPIYFMDFETLQLAVPKHNGTKPWQQMTIQWSVHILRDGEVIHHEFIHDSEEDPRKPFIDSLLDVLGDTGSIVVYSSFEKSRLNDIAKAFPEYKNRIDKVNARLWDMLVIFRKFYCDARFKGSNSIKAVLPVMVPSLSYKDLEVQEGGAAMVEYARMIGLPEGEERENIKNNLLEYCKLDTLAMVEIYRKLIGQ